MSKTSIIDRDLSAKNGKGNSSLTELALKSRAARQNGAGIFQILGDFRKLNRGRGRLTLDEFFMYKLYDRTAWTEDEKSRFLSAEIHNSIIRDCIDTTWWAATEDKWLSSTLLKSCGIPMPETLAVIDGSPRVFPGTTKIISPETLREFLYTVSTKRIFAKNLNGMWSAGALIIDGWDDEGLSVANESSMSYQEFFTSLGGTSYLLQEIIKNHQFFDDICSGVSTVRFYNLVGSEGLSTPFVALKLAVGSNVADNFWRTGNLICDVDPATGVIRTIVGKQDGELVRHSGLQGSSRSLIGEMLPNWKAAKELNRQVALIHARVQYSSTDVAITDAGPVLIEVNTGGAFELPQIATGRGFLTDEVRNFFVSRGSTKV